MKTAAGAAVMCAIVVTAFLTWRFTGERVREETRDGPRPGEQESPAESREGVVPDATDWPALLEAFSKERQGWKRSTWSESMARPLGEDLLARHMSWELPSGETLSLGVYDCSTIEKAKQLQRKLHVPIPPKTRLVEPRLEIETYYSDNSSSGTVRLRYDHYHLHIVGSRVGLFELRDYLSDRLHHQ